MPDRYSRMFAEYAAATGWADIPDDTLHEVKRRLLDSVGVAVSALDEDAPTAARRYAALHPDADGASVWGSPARASAEAAGFANGVAVRYLDYNDTYLSLEPLHPSDVIPALLAVAEVRERPPREYIAAVAVAYEIAVSLCDAASLRRHGWDHVNFLAIGVAASAGRLLGLPPERIQHAVSIATVPHAAMRETRSGELSMWKAAAAANAARNAVFAALLAEAGMTGPFRPFEGEMAFRRQLLDDDAIDDGRLQRLEERISPRRILDTYIKFWPVEYHAQSAVDAALQIRSELDDPSTIETIHIETFAASYEIIAKDPEKWDPRTRETADHSLQYIVCAALQDGAVDMNTFDDARIRRPDTLALLRDRVRLDEDPSLTAGYPDGIPNRISVRTADGRTLVREVRYPRGHARNPMSDEEVVRKFHANVRSKVGDDRADRVANAVMSLDGAESLKELTTTLADLGAPT
jgi:2-methylcitrate dehydratase